MDGLKTFRWTWARWGGVLVAGLILGCSGAPLPPNPGTDTAESATRQVARGDTGYQVQQNGLRPGRPGTEERMEYCKRWQCAFTAREDYPWCMRSCYVHWDLE